jgi:hypothetical protein
VLEPAWYGLLGATCGVERDADEDQHDGKHDDRGENVHWL